MEKITYYSNGGEFEADKLLPCPFCGSAPELIFIGNDYTKSRKVEIKCKKCRIRRTDAGIHKDHEWVARKAIEQWNERLANVCTSTSGLNIPCVIGSACESHKTKKRSYLEQSEYAERQIKRGVHQYKCTKCGWWIFPNEI